MKTTNEQPSTLCSDRPIVTFSAKKKKVVKKKGEPGMKAATEWLFDETNGYCESSLCVEGDCKAVHEKPIKIRIIEETDDYVIISFETTVSCKCS